MENFIKMASNLGICIVLLFAILSVATAGYVEALAAGAFDPSSSHVELRVALRDGYYSKYADIISGQWVTDTSSQYTEDTTEILNYCKKKYPNSEVINIVDSSHPVVIDQWCPVSGEECSGSAQLTYYRCLAGPFESDALMVYNVCKFFHKHDENTCREPTYWKQVADKECQSRKMALNSTGMLLPCGDADHFKGVEYTCCPPPTYRQLPSMEEETEVEIEEDERPEGGEEMEEEQHLQAPAPERDNVVAEPQITSNILADPYFSESRLTGSAEKKEYGDAKSRLSVGQKSKMARVMQQWQEAEEHYETLKAKDPKAAEKMRKEMTERFEQTIGTMEAENAEETEELREAHQVHIEGALREKINASYEAYHIAVDVAKPKSKKILHTLRRYLHMVQKARQHYIGHYKHLRKTDPLMADQHKRVTLQKLRALDLEIAHSIDQLQSLPDLYAELKPKVDALLASTQDLPEDAALIRATQEETIAEATEAPPAQRSELEPVAEIMDAETDTTTQEEQGRVETEEEVPDVEEEITEEDTEAPAIAKTTATKTSTQAKTKPSTQTNNRSNSSAATNPGTNPSAPTKPRTKPSAQTKPKTSTATQTEPEPPTPGRDTQQPLLEETEIEVPAVKVPVVVAVKPIESYLDEELTGPMIATDVDQPMTLIVAQKPKPKAKAQKPAAAAARVEKQRLVNRQDVNSMDNSVTKKRMQLHSEPMMAFGLACGVLAVATVLVIAVLIVRRKTRRTPVNNGFTEIDPNLTVEQRHIVAMQQNGYENPTYKYFDMQ